MRDCEKTKEQLIDELALLRQEIDDLKANVADRTSEAVALSDRVVELESQFPPTDSAKIRICGLDIEWLPQEQCLLGNLPVAMMWIDTTLASLMAGVQAMIGTERFALILQREGRKSVEADWQVISQSANFAEGFQELSKVAFVAGWGNWQMVSLDWEKQECSFRVKKSWEGRYQKALGVCWGSAMLAGKLAGYCTKLFGKNCWTEQTAFIARGDEFDEFLVLPSHRCIEEEIEKLLGSDEASSTGMAVALEKLRREIRDRERIEQELRESEQRFRATFEQAAVGIAHIGLEGRWLRVNQKFCDIVGYTREELLSSTFQEISHPDDVNLHMEYLRQLLLGEIQNYSIEKRYLRKDRSSVWINLTVSLRRSSNGTAKYAIAVVEDISDRKQVQAELNRIFHLSFDMLAVATVDGYFKRLNPAWESTFGHTLSHFLNLPFFDFVHPEDRAATVAEVEKLKSGVTTPYFENRFRCKDGSYKWLAWSCVPVVAEGLIYCVARDITERKQAEEALRNSEARERERASQLQQALEELKQAQSLLIQSEKMSSLGQLLAGVAHEINNPVNFIYGNLCHASEYAKDLLGLVELYQEHYTNPIPEIEAEAESIDLEFLMEDLPKLLSSMKVGADRIREIVMSLRNFSRLDESQMKEVDLHEGIDSTLMILHNRIKARSDSPGVQIVKEYGKLPKINCYPGQLNQVFMNIITNAIDALEEGSKEKSHPLATICIRTEVLDSNCIAIRIIDNGPGMSESVRSQLFDPFFTTKPVGVGTGLGLSISYQIVVEKHRGQLRCLSEQGKGTEFIIEIPIRQES
ncbi:PAS domain S-box protein [Aerosakkonema sp. BLCC-F183]|uniref:PAS domain S-box protein n=1 Tax=Aerosakkonema sp. BLCC-F183 TaxID=3342834 RepID=UPI0035BA6F5F